jgi:hypothetical protein
LHSHQLAKFKEKDLSLLKKLCFATSFPMFENEMSREVVFKKKVSCFLDIITIKVLKFKPLIFMEE